MPLSPGGERQEQPQSSESWPSSRPTPKGQRPCQRCLLARSRAEDGDGFQASSQRAREEQVRRPTPEEVREAAVGIGAGNGVWRATEPVASDAPGVWNIRPRSRHAH